VQHVTTADRVAVHHRDHRLRDVAQHGVQRRDLVELGIALLLIAAAAERLVAGTGEYEDADVVIVPCVAHAGDQLAHR
jgi:hypothetical protein